MNPESAVSDLEIQHIKHMEHRHIDRQNNPSDAGGQRNGHYRLNNTESGVHPRLETTFDQLTRTLTSLGKSTGLLANGDQLQDSAWKQKLAGPQSLADFLSTLYVHCNFGQ